MTEIVFRLKRHLTSFQIMILGFAGVILLGALVLMLRLRNADFEAVYPSLGDAARGGRALSLRGGRMDPPAHRRGARGAGCAAAGRTAHTSCKKEIE